MIDVSTLEGDYEVDNGIVPADNGLEQRFNPNGFFDGDVDAQAARMAVAELKGLEEKLKAAEKFGEYACQFAVLEAEMYIKISEYEGAEAKLTESKRNLINWIRSKTPEEMDEIMSEVSTGMRIGLIRRREQREQHNDLVNHAAEREYQRISSEIVKQLDTSGHTHLTTSTFYDQWHSIGKPDPHTVKAYTEKTRDQLIKKGGRGLGDGAGTYMKVEACKRTEVAQIVETRLESIVGDLKTIKQICDETHFVVPEEGVKIIVDLIKSLASPTALNITV